MSKLSFMEIEKRKRRPPLSSGDTDASMVMSLFFDAAVSITKKGDGYFVIEVSEGYDEHTYEGRCLLCIEHSFEGYRFVSELDAVLSMIDTAAGQKICDDCIEETSKE